MSSKISKKLDYGYNDERMNQYNTPHKLSLPTTTTRKCFSSEAPTPPPRSAAISIPFKWEEVPGKPRPCHIELETKLEREEVVNNNVVRALELPPRLLLESSNINNNNTPSPSPTTVLEGPYVGRAVSFTTSFRDNNNKEISSSGVNFGSSRWIGELKTNNRIDREGSFDFSSWSVDGGDKVKITRVRRRGSFSSFSHGTSHFLASIYGSFKQVVPWKRKQEKQQGSNKIDNV